MCEDPARDVIRAVATRMFLAKSRLDNVVNSFLPEGIHGKTQPLIQSDAWCPARGATQF